MDIQAAYQAKKEIEQGRYADAEQWAKANYGEIKAERIGRRITEFYGEKVQYLLWKNKNNNGINIGENGSIEIKIVLPGVNGQAIAAVTTDM
ncbi:MAG: hypothetical protein LBT19_02565 [Candidatus Nomurabacteria bacterium]|nr:hypothetical protein [Candidatus Nomurabacteria bacterium]